MKIKNLFSFFFVLYCLLFFLLTSFFYLYSINLGSDGLSVPLFNGGDEKFYYEQALNIASNRPAVLTSIHAVILGWILKLFHTHEVFILRLFNFIGNISILIVGLKILFQVQMERRNLTSGIIFILLISYYPSYVENSSGSILRDCWIIFYYLLSIQILLMIIKTRKLNLKVIYSIILLLSLSLLFGYRDYALLSFLSSAVIYFLFIQRQQSLNRSKKIYFYIFFGFTLMYTFLKSYMFPIVNLSLQDILTYRVDNMELFAGRTQMNISLDQSNVFLFYVNYFNSIVSNAFGPFPWQFKSMGTVILFFAESLLFSFIALKIIKLRRRLNNFDFFLIINSLVWFMLIGIFNDNIGAAARLRMIGWFPLLIVFAKVYGEQLIHKKQLNDICNIENIGAENK
ncbi:hypothetical protein [Viridibacillus arvi]|uniref:hypothetical protein n=1 Tax=Viridibacillus arvi TaxID=263475 RepID=UPI003D0085C0